MTENMKIWDPLRRKDVALTPEEKVRQWFIGVLSVQMEVPLHLMMSESGFKLGGKQFRADIIVYDRSACPLMVVECKRPDVELTAEVLDQIVRYNMVLGVKYLTITNGKKTVVLQKGPQGFSPVVTLPKYSEMLCQR